MCLLSMDTRKALARESHRNARDRNCRQQYIVKASAGACSTDRHRGRVLGGERGGGGIAGAWT